LNTISNELMQKREGVEREKYRQFLDVIVQMNDFQCDRCKKSFGDVTTWGEDRALVIDGLSGLAKMSMQLKVGSKPIKSQPDWGAAMDNLENFLDMLTNAMKTLFVLIAHVEPQKDEVTGGVKNMAMSLGNKLSPKIPRNFDEVILSTREGSNFYWDNAAAGTVTKASRMPLSNKNPPDFQKLLSYYQP
jgi:AAA domain